MENNETHSLIKDSWTWNQKKIDLETSIIIENTRNHLKRPRNIENTRNHLKRWIILENTRNHFETIDYYWKREKYFQVGGNISTEVKIFETYNISEIEKMCMSPMGHRTNLCHVKNNARTELGLMAGAAHKLMITLVM